MTEGEGSFEQAFEELYRIAYWASHRILHSHEDSEDVAIEALARASVRWRFVRSNPKPWLTRVAVNLAIDTARRRRAEFAISDIAAPEEAIAERMDLLNAISTLSKRQRSTITLRYLVGLSEHETAMTLGCSVGAVKQHSTRALKKLRQSYRNQWMLDWKDE